MLPSMLYCIPIWQLFAKYLAYFSQFQCIITLMNAFFPLGWVNRHMRYRALQIRFVGANATGLWHIFVYNKMIRKRAALKI
jgi:hypothetical protein